MRGWIFAVACSLVPAMAHAHGETARSGGSANAVNAVGGLVTPGWGFGLRFELRQYDSFSDAELLQFARDGEDVHQHAQEMSAFLDASVTPLPDLSLTAVLPFNAFRGFREAELDATTGMPHIVTDEFSGGIGDLLVVGRYRVLERGASHFALLGGIKLPTGMTRETDDAGERIGAHNQPGSGSVDFQLGAAYTFSSGDFGLTADAIAHIRTDGVLGYRAGNMLQADLAASYRIGPVALVAELNYLVSETDVEYDLVLANSGVNTLYASPGVLVTIGTAHTLYASASIPIIQALPGIQNTEMVRASLGWAVTLGAPSEPAAHDHPHEHGHPHTHGNQGEAPHTHLHRTGQPHHHRAVDSEPERSQGPHDIAAPQG